MGCKFIAALFFLSTTALAYDYHGVGWFNTFLPGGGQLLMQNYGRAASQAAIETSTFGFGYVLSKRQPLTLDGVPEDLPNAETTTIVLKKRQQVCTEKNGKTVCQWITHTHTKKKTDSTEISNLKGISAEILQEFGIKYHFVNVFESYREAATNPDGSMKDPWIDTLSTKDLFFAPFRSENLFTPWVYVPFAGVLGYTLLDYYEQKNTGLTPLQPMKPLSNTLYGFNYVVWQPIGSGAPEEMFFRGFLQNEIYHSAGSPWASVPIQALAFSLAHAPSGRITAAVAGLYMGILAQKNHGKLSEGIALHFWSNVVLGVATTLLTYQAQGKVLPIGLDLKIPF